MVLGLQVQQIWVIHYKARYGLQRKSFYNFFKGFIYLIFFQICQENKIKFLIFTDVLGTTTTACGLSGFVHPGIPVEQSFSEKI